MRKRKEDIRLRMADVAVMAHSVVYRFNRRKVTAEEAFEILKRGHTILWNLKCASNYLLEYGKWVTTENTGR